MDNHMNQIASGGSEITETYSIRLYLSLHRCRNRWALEKQNLDCLDSATLELEQTAVQLRDPAYSILLVP